LECFRMEHSFRKFMTRLELLTLESRLQPGSLLTSGIDMSGMADLVAPEAPARIAQIKRLQDSQDIQLVDSATAKADAAVAPRQLAAPSSQTSTATSSLPLNSGSQKLVNQTIVSPAQAKAQAVPVQTTAPTRDINPSGPKVVQKSAAQFTRAALQMTTAKPHMTDVMQQVQVKPVDPSLIHITHHDQSGDQGGTRAATPAAANAVESGKGADIGGSYIFGQQTEPGGGSRPAGTYATVSKIGANGSAVWTVSVGPGAHEFNGGEVITHTGQGPVHTDVYGVGNFGATDGLLFRSDEVLTPASIIVATLSFTGTDPAAVLRLNNVDSGKALSSALATRDLGVTGSLDSAVIFPDGAMRMIMMNIEPHFCDTAGPILCGGAAVHGNDGDGTIFNYSVAVAFFDGVGGTVVQDTEGLDVQLGRFVVPPTDPNGHEAYHGGRIIDTVLGAVRNITLRLSPANAGPVIDWNGIVWFGPGTESANPANGVWALDYDAGAAAGSGLFMGGVYDCFLGPCGTALGDEGAMTVEWDPTPPTPPTPAFGPDGGGVWTAGAGASFGITDLRVPRATGQYHVSDRFGATGVDIDAGGDSFDSTQGVFLGGYSIPAAGTMETGTGVDIVPPGIAVPRDHLLSANVGGDLGTLDPDGGGTPLADGTYAGTPSGWAARLTEQFDTAGAGAPFTIFGFDPGADPGPEDWATHTDDTVV
jgi:hypothetical protein